MWHFINSIWKYVCFVSQASQRAAENGTYYLLNLQLKCYLISVHCILSSCLIPNWLAENKHSLKIIRVKTDPKRPLLCKTCPFKVWSSEIPHVDWVKETRMNRKKVTTLTGTSCLEGWGEWRGDLLTHVILESRFEGYLSKRRNWICWERKAYREICSLEEGSSVLGSHMNNDLKMLMPCGKR